MAKDVPAPEADLGPGAGAPGSAARAAHSSRAAWMGALCYSLWGVLPLYFHLLAKLGVGAFETIAHRSLWAVLWAGGLVLVSRQGRHAAEVLRSPRTLLFLALSTAAIFINWTVYVWAVQAGHVLEGSLGYYINPLMNMAAGALFFRERLDRTGQVAIGLAGIGVAVQTAAIGHLPVVSLALAASFCAYGLIRRQTKAEAQTGLFVECLYLGLPALAYVVWLERTGAGHFLKDPNHALLLMAAGPATVAPLALFSWAARRLSLTTLGFLQFIAPTLQFLAGLFLGETFTPLRAASFGFIWLGVAVFAWGAWRKGRALARR